jgi:hypothetical protein
MGFGFNLLFAFILLPGTVILLLIWGLTRKRAFGLALGCIWIPVFVLAFIAIVLRWASEKKSLSKNDFRGRYVINRSYFAGKQANWQYDSFRFEIKDNDSIYFYVTDKEKILETYKGTINTTNNYVSARLLLNMQHPTHHILSSNPTIIRKHSTFILIF